MKKYSNGERIIMATERAFHVIYKNQEFKPIEEVTEGNEEEKSKKRSKKK